MQNSTIWCEMKPNYMVCPGPRLRFINAADSGYRMLNPGSLWGYDWSLNDVWHFYVSGPHAYVNRSIPYRIANDMSSSFYLPSYYHTTIQTIASNFYSCTILSIYVRYGNCCPWCWRSNSTLKNIVKAMPQNISIGRPMDPHNMRLVTMMYQILL